MKDFHHYFDLCATPVALISESGTILHINSAFEQQLGDFRNKTFQSLQLTSANYQKEIELRDLMNGISGTHAPLAVRTGMQPDRIFRLSASHIPQSTDLLIQCWDITQQYLLENKIAERKTVLSKIIDSFPEGICAYDEQGIIHIWNNRCEEITGYPEEEIAGNREGFQKLFATKAEMLDAFAKWNIRDNNVIRNWEMAIKRKDGEKRILRVTVRYREKPILPGLHQWVIASDITELTKTKEQLRDSEERYRIISKVTNDAIWDWDLINNELWWNDGITELFGYNTRDIDNTIEWWAERLHPDYRDAVNSRLQEHIKHGLEFWSDEYLFRKKNGDYAYIYDRGYVLKDEHGKPYRMIGGMKDLSEQKEFENLSLAKDEQLKEIIEYNSSKVVTPALRVTQLALTLALMTHENVRVKDHVDRLLIAARDAEKAVRSMNERFK